MPRLEISLHGHLLVAGGQASALGVDLATALRFDGRRYIPYIPATALRGAIRLQLEALLSGAELDASGPYPLEANEGQAALEEPDDTVSRLFGFSGPPGSREGSHEGLLRFGDALPADAEQAASTLGLRPGVELNDFTSTAADQKLFFREVVEVFSNPLVFHARLDLLEPEKVQEQDLKYLKAAAEATDAIGAGKAKGGGAVSIRWFDDDTAGRTQIQGSPEGAGRARLVFTLLEPAHFGDGGPYANHHATRSYIPGTTVRGALAWALLRNDLAKPQDAGFQALFLDRSPASFGDALLVHDPTADPRVSPATERERRGAKGLRRDILISELARDRINDRLQGRYFRSDDDPFRYDPVPARPIEGLARSIRTRVSIDRWFGTAAGRKLFSIEQIEPWLADEKTPLAVRFVSWVEGLTPVASALLGQLRDKSVFLGAGRNHGLGSVDLQIEFQTEPGPGNPEALVRALGEAVERRAEELAVRAALSDSFEKEDESLLPLVLVAHSNYVPSRGEISHPLAEPEVTCLDLGIFHPQRAFLSSESSGGYDQRSRKGEPLKDLIPAIGAGSVFVYSVPAENLSETLERLLPILRRGIGRRVESGAGRFGLFEILAEEKSDER